MIKPQVMINDSLLEKDSYVKVKIKNEKCVEGLLLNYSIYDGVINNVLIQQLSGIRTLVYGHSIKALEVLCQACINTCG